MVVNNFEIDTNNKVAKKAIKNLIKNHNKTNNAYSYLTLVYFNIYVKIHFIDYIILEKDNTIIINGNAANVLVKIHHFNRNMAVKNVIGNLHMENVDPTVFYVNRVIYYLINFEVFKSLVD